MTEEQKHFRKFFYTPSPYHGEAISSFLFRLSTGNGIKYQKFYQETFHSSDHFANDIDISICSDQILLIAQRINLSIKDLEDLTFINSNYAKRTLRMWLIPMRSRAGNSGYQYCPNCKKSYFRLVDRFLFVCICKFCGAFLKQDCSSCGKLINFRSPRSRYSSIRKVNECFFCQKTIFINCSAEFADPRLVIFQEKFLLQLVTISSNKLPLNEFLEELAIAINHYSKRHSFKAEWFDFQNLASKERLQILYEILN